MYYFSLGFGFWTQADLSLHCGSATSKLCDHGKVFNFPELVSLSVEWRHS